MPDRRRRGWWARYGDTVAITTIVDTSTFITESRDGLVQEGLLGALHYQVEQWVNAFCQAEIFQLLDAGQCVAGL